MNRRTVLWISLSVSCFPVPMAQAGQGVVMGDTDTGRGEFYSVQLHIHGSLSEGAGRMVDHAARAREAGTDLLWWTDHGGMLNPRTDDDLQAMEFDFEQRRPYIPPTLTVPGHGFVPEEDSQDFMSYTGIDSTARSGGYSMAIVAEDGSFPDSSRFGGFRYKVDHHHAVDSHFQNIDIFFSARLIEPQDPSRLFSVRVELSTDPHGRSYWLEFLATDGPLPPDGSHIRYARIPELALSGWTDLHIPVSQHVRSRFEHGRDMHYHGAIIGWRVTGDGYSGVLIDDYSYEVSGPVRNEVLDIVQGFLDSLPEPEPVHFVGYETAGGRTKLQDHHLTVFAADGIPELADFFDPRFLPEEYPRNVVRWAHKRDYVTSYAHIFGPSGDRNFLSDEERDARRDTLLANDGYGVDLLEVGYDNRARPMEDHLQVWDDLLRRDVFVTGTGVTDKHESHFWDVVRNRFVTWVWSEALTRARVLLHLTSGHASFGDPIVVGPDAFLLVRDGQIGRDRFDTGDVVLSSADEFRIQFMGRFEGPTMELAMIAVHADGADTLTMLVEGDGETFNEYRTVPIGDATHVRAELRDLDYGRLHLASNPVHFRRLPPDPERPGLRRRRIVDLR